MSKSLGNGIDPLLVIDEYGADALRFTLATGNSPGNDMRFSDERVKASRNFANKLWNAARFVLMYLGEDYKYDGLPQNLAVEDKWILNKLDKLVADVTKNIDSNKNSADFSNIASLLQNIDLSTIINMFSSNKNYTNTNENQDFSNDSIFNGINPSTILKFQRVITSMNKSDPKKNLLLSLTHDIQDLYNETQEGNGQKWLMIELEDDNQRYEDVKKIIKIRNQ